jgi:hypothetical protein
VLLGVSSWTSDVRAEDTILPGGGGVLLMVQGEPPPFCGPFVAGAWRLCPPKSPRRVHL